MKRLHHPRRYQLTKSALIPFKTGHPWIYRNHLSSAVEPFPNGQWLQLVDTDNRVVGYGILEKTDGLVGIRVLRRGAEAPSPDWLRSQLDRALARRENLRRYSEAFRALHGENDGFPGVVLDVYADTGVLQTYAPSTDLLGRYVGAYLRRKLGLKSLIWKLPAKRKVQAADGTAVRRLFGPEPKPVGFREGKLTLHVETMSGQKSGAFLDLRALRKWIGLKDWSNQGVLNLFAYTGTLGLAAETAGAVEVINVDISEAALAAGKRFHQAGRGKQQYLTADVFEWLGQPARQKQSGHFGLVIVDPPLMASRMEQVPRVLRKYAELYQKALPLVRPGGFLVVACCTSRVKREAFQKNADQVLGHNAHFVQSLSPEEDHPVGFAEGDYLKILIYQKKRTKKH